MKRINKVRMEVERSMKIAITGGIGSGKSTICESHDSDRYIPARAGLQDKTAGTDC